MANAAKRRGENENKIVLRARTYADVEKKPQDWTWYPWLPTGCLSYCYGLPGAGKSGGFIAISALITRGLQLPSAFDEGDEDVPTFAPVHGKVVYQSAEDDTGSNIRPRLEANGATCSDVIFAEGENKNECAIFDILDCCDQLEDLVRETGAKLVCIDPIQSFASDIDMNRATDMWKLTNALIGIAKRNHCAVVVVGHQTKNVAASDIYGGMGSSDLAAAARSVFSIRYEEKEGVHVIKHIKSSLVKKSPELEFLIERNGAIEFLGQREPEENAAPGEAAKESKLEMTMNLLRDILTNKAYQPKNVIQACEDSFKAMGMTVSRSTVKCAAEELNVIHSELNGVTFWSLPE